MGAEQNGQPSWVIDEAESPEVKRFRLKYGEHFNALTEAIGTAFAEHDGNTILLLDTSLRALVDIIAEGLERHRVVIKVE